jgi:4-carboxymuconolactone decarboxylase
MTIGGSEQWRRDAAAVRARLHPGSGSSDLAGNAMAELAPEFADVLGDWAMSRYAHDALDLRTRALCTVAALAALGEDRYTQNWIENALHAGATRDEVVSLLEQLEVYVGTQGGACLHRGQGCLRPARRLTTATVGGGRAISGVHLRWHKP